MQIWAYYAWHHLSATEDKGLSKHCCPWFVQLYRIPSRYPAVSRCVCGKPPSSKLFKWQWWAGGEETHLFINCSNLIRRGFIAPFNCQEGREQERVLKPLHAICYMSKARQHAAGCNCGHTSLTLRQPIKMNSFLSTGPSSGEFGWIRDGTLFNAHPESH